MTSKTESHSSHWSTYETSLTNAKNADKISYVGPRAIFDPNFVPPVFFPQKSQSMLLQGIIQDALEDEYPTNVNLYGLKGTGKNLLVNHFLQWYQKTILTEIENNKADVAAAIKNSICILHCDCAQRELSQIFYSLISQISDHLNLTLQLKDAIIPNSATMWNTLKFLIQKVTQPILLYLHQSENLGNEILSKFFVFAKSTQNLQIITSINTGLQQYSFKQYERMDHKVKMDNFTCRDLHDITHNRSLMAFQHQLEPEAIDLIVNYISEFDLQVPGACMNYLKEVYPIIGQRGAIHSDNLRDISQYYFEGFTVDALSMADFVMNTSLEDRLFLDNIVNYFRNLDRFFIPFHEIRNAYSMSCEEMGFKFDKTEFYQSFAKISDAQIIRPNTLAVQQGAVKHNGVYLVDHFLTLPMDEVSDILNFSFGQGVEGMNLNQLRLN